MIDHSVYSVEHAQTQATVHIINTSKAVISHKRKEEKLLGANRLPETKNGGVRTERSPAGRTKTYSGGDSEGHSPART